MPPKAKSNAPQASDSKPIVPTSKPKKVIPPPVQFVVTRPSVALEAFVDEIPRTRMSHYQRAIEQLQDSPKGSVLRFESRKCLPQLEKRAKALGVKLRFHLDGEAVEVAIVPDKPK